MKKTVEFLVMAFAALVAGSAGATMWTSHSSTLSTAGDEYTITVDGQSILVRAYSTKTNGSQSGTFSASALVKTFPDLEGFGIDNTLTGQDSGETSFPEWSVDNLQLYDLLVFELPNDNMKLQALSLGWAEAGSDISVFFGGNGLGAGYNFSNACFTGCTNAISPNPNTTPGTTLSALGFSQVNISNAAVNSEIAMPHTNTGRYVAISGSLVTSPGDDKFKVNMIKASVPTPGTLALLGLALLGMGALRRRQVVAA
jgi:hypothetical protein